MIIGRTKARLISELIIDQDIPMETFKLTGLGAGAAPGHSLQYQQAIRQNLLTAQGDMIYRDGGLPARLAKSTEGYYLKQGATIPEWAALPSRLTVAETEVYDAAAPVAWTDLDLSGTIGTQATLVMLKHQVTVDGGYVAFRRNGDTDEAHRAASTFITAINGVFQKAGIFDRLIVETDAGGIVEWKADYNKTTTLDVVAYIK